MVLDGKVRAAICSLTSQNRGGVLLPEDPCTKTGQPVIKVLEGKHPDLRMPNLPDPNNISFEEYADGVPDVVPIDINEVDIESTASKIRGSVGPSSMDAAALSAYLLQYECALGEL